MDKRTSKPNSRDTQQRRIYLCYRQKTYMKITWEHHVFFVLRSFKGRRNWLFSFPFFWQI